MIGVSTLVFRGGTPERTPRVKPYGGRFLLE